MRLVLFNLIPYREGRERKQRLYFGFKAALGVASVVFICLATHGEFERRLMQQQYNLAQIRATAQDITQRVAKADQLKNELNDLKMKVSTLQSLEERSLWAGRIMALLDATKPQDVALRHVEVKQGSIRLVGVTVAVPVLSTWVKVLETEGNLLRGADLKLVKAQGSNSPSEKGSLAPHHEFDVLLHAAGVPDVSPPADTKTKEVAHAIN